MSPVEVNYSHDEECGLYKTSDGFYAFWWEFIKLNAALSLQEKEEKEGGLRQVKLSVTFNGTSQKDVYQRPR